MRTTSFLASLALAAVAGGLRAGTALCDAAAPPPKEQLLETQMTAGLLEPPVPVPVAFGPQMPAGAKTPTSLGTLKYALLRLGEPNGPLGAFVLGWRDAGKDGVGDSLYVDSHQDGDLSKGGNGDLENAGDMHTRRSMLPLKRPAGDPDNVTDVPYVFVRHAGPDAPWHAVPAGRRTAEVVIEDKTYAIALVDLDGDGAITEGKDVLWFDANADGVFDPAPAARERLAIPAVVKAGPRLLKLSVPFPSGLKIKVETLPSGEPQAGLPAPTPTLLSWRLAFATATQTAVDERAAAVTGARTVVGDATWDWLVSLIDTSLEAPVRAAAIEGLGDPAFGADKSAEKLKDIVWKRADVALRGRALTLLGGHPGAGAGNGLKTFVEDRNKPLGERIHAMRSLAKFKDFAPVVKRHMLGSDPPELKAAAYEGLAEQTPDDVNLHTQGLDLDSPGARGEAIAALGRLGEKSALGLARKEAKNQQALVRAGVVRVLVASGKKADLVLALEAAKDDAPIEKFTDLNGDGKWQEGEPFVDGNGNGIFDPDAGVRRGLKDALRGERGRDEVRKFVVSTMLVDPKDDWVRDIAIDVLIDYDDPAVRKALYKHAADEKVREAKLKILDAAILVKKDVPVDEFLRIAGDKDEAVRASASAALVAAAPDDPKVRALVAKLLASSSWTDQVQACEAAAQGGMKEAIPGVIQALKSKRWSVRAVAVEALGKLHPKEAFEDLLVAMKEAGERTRLSLAIKRVLFRMTGADLPDDPDQWRSWDAGHPGWEVPAEAPVLVSDGRKYATFFGIPLESKRIVFVIDHSGSMQIPDTSGEKIRTRWEILLEQLDRAIGGLPAKGVEFNLIFFSQGVDSFRPKSVDATPAERDAAKKFIASIEPKGETNVWAGLETALEEPDVDTIILLTDGQPSTGQFTSTTDILREVSFKNRFRRVVISTVSIGQDSPFLRRLAAANHGAYARR